MADNEDRSLAEWAANDSGGDPVAAIAAPVETPVVEVPAVESEAAAAPVVESVASAEPVEDGAAIDPEIPVAQIPALKKPQPLPAWMKERLAEQTAKQREAERQAAEAEGRAKVAEAELEALRKRAAPDDTASPVQVPNATNPEYVPRSQVEAEAQRIASERAFNAQADQAYFAGKSAYKDFDEALQPLNAMGALARKDFQEAALATGAAHDVIYALGSDPDKASQILGYLKTGNNARATAEMTKLAMGIEAQKVAAAKPKKTPISAAPAPIKPVGGSALPTVDLEKADDDTFDRELSGILRRAGW